MQCLESLKMKLVCGNLMFNWPCRATMTSDSAPESPCRYEWMNVIFMSHPGWTSGHLYSVYLCNCKLMILNWEVSHQLCHCPYNPVEVDVNCCVCSSHACIVVEEVLCMGFKNFLSLCYAALMKVSVLLWKHFILRCHLSSKFDVQTVSSSFVPWLLY